MQEFSGTKKNMNWDTNCRKYIGVTSTYSMKE